MSSTFNQLTLFLIIATILILLMGAFVVFILFLYNKRQVTNNNTLIQLKTEFEKDRLKAQIEIQENTFQEISREIHDNITLTLTLVKLNLTTNQNSQNLNESIKLIGKAIDDLKDLSRSMNSDIIQECGLISALSMEIHRVNKLNGIKIILKILGNPVFLDSQKELYIFRIIQEAINNILKHSKAQNVSVTMQYLEFDLKIEIKDDGCGFKRNMQSKGGITHVSLGLKNMEKRIQYLNGNFKIQSKIGEGTQLNFVLPIKDVA